MQIEKELYQMIIDSLQSNINTGKQAWLSGCNLKYCQECCHCGFNHYKIRPILEDNKVVGLCWDYDGIKNSILAPQQ